MTAPPAPLPRSARINFLSAAKVVYSRHSINKQCDFVRAVEVDPRGTHACAVEVDPRGTHACAAEVDPRGTRAAR
jgi:hypothetical protein